MRRISVVTAVMLLSAAGGGVWGQRGSQQNCEVQRLCRECIQTLGCVWCINPKADASNCQHAASININSFCAETDLQDPKNQIKVVQDDELTGSKQKTAPVNQQQDEIIQLKPQRVKLYLRKDVPQRLNITYRRARDYPLDLYYLMDLSNSMKDDKDNLARVGNLLAATMTNLTSQFALGFGSFVDKVIMPFTDTVPLNRQKHCPQCAYPYSFRNDMKLSQDHAQFKERVKNARISGNLDYPEGGFDALMQAMVCKDEIGWRDVARRILVFSTDAKFHHAGDGRLAGVVMPNDEQCHLNDQGEYTAFDKYDYPSIGQINKVAKDENINIIFAVLTNQRLFSELSKNIETSSFGMLQEGSTNVVDLIEKQYYSISSSVTLTDNSTTDIAIKYRSACKGGQLSDTNKCDRIQENDEVIFELEITAKKCPADGKNSVVEVKTLEDKVILDIEFLCSCNCPENVNPDSLTCKNGGSPVCGVCECPEGYYGEECQCGGDDNSFGISENQIAKCMASDKDTKPCSGRGFCRCGVCICHEKEVTGTFCQCNRRKCMGSKGLCSGHGVCDCNECKCDEGYSGALCQCEDKNCIQQGSDKVCSDRGTCECGKCNCRQEKNVTYTGRYCEDCLSCGKGKCNKFKDCVQCVHFGIGPRKLDCNTCESSQFVESLDEKLSNGYRLCTFKDEEGCYVNFTYRYEEDTNRDEVFVQSKRQCPEPAPILSIVFGLIAAIVSIGVLTLILWKVFTTIHDRREYAKFEKETKNVNFGAEVNPLFIEATTTTQNPMFDAQETK